MKKKILILSSWYPNPSSPVSGSFVQDQALALSRQHDVAVLAPVLLHWRKYVAEYKDGNHWEMEDANGIGVLIKSICITPGWQRYYKLWSSYYYWETMQGFKELTLAWGVPDILHAHIVLPGGLAALKLGRAHNIPVVLTEHSGPFSSQLGTPITRRLALKTLQGVNTVIAVSPALKKQIHDFYQDAKVEVIGNVVDENYFNPEPPAHIKSHLFRFLTISSLVSGKGIDDLIEATRLLVLQVGKRFEVIIGGDGPTRSDLEKRVVEYGISDLVRFTGFLKRFEVREWINKSDVFVLPSHGETFSVALVEAMACGKPVIATRCGGPEFIVTPETGLMVDVSNPSSLASAMESFLKGHSVFDSDQIRESVTKRFGQMAFLNRMNTIYESVHVRAGGGRWL